ncbi:MAG TPA: chorismate synthase [Actinomycetota bacterium]|nr:chorismate synthase [Actinomycetota bacterium]
MRTSRALPEPLPTVALAYHGAVIRYLTAGESHGPALTVIVEGLPAGIPVQTKSIGDELARRRLGYGRGPRMKFERDELELLGGVRFGRTLGSPVAIVIRNTEWAKWDRVMSPEGSPSGNVLTEPRPGHADLAGMLKYDFADARNVLERASARETAARTVAGALAKTLLAELGMRVVSHVVGIGAAQADPAGPRPIPADLEAIDASPVRCFDPVAALAMAAEIEAAQEAGDSLGGVFEVIAYGVPVGLGSHVHYDRKIDARLAYHLMSIQAIKGVEVGDGFALAGLRGTAAHDEIFFEDGELRRHSDRAGGTEGGMTIGPTLRVRAAMKPLATLKQRLRTVDMATGEAAGAFRERTDSCAVPAAAVVGEAVVAWVLAEAVVEKFGGDTLADLQGAMAAFRLRIRRPPAGPDA